jgi:ABC-type multidrug transport system fused ATPase/permease subunit
LIISGQPQFVYFAKYFSFQVCQLVFESSNVYTGLMQAVGASEKVFEIIDRKPQIRNDGHLAPASLEGKVEFRNVSFKYPSQNDALALKVVHLVANVVWVAD